MSHEPMRMPEDRFGWELLPENSDLRCGRDEMGWSFKPSRVGEGGDDGRCRRRAIWVHRATCNCGECDMTRHACSECLVAELMDDLARRERTIERAVTLVRELDPEIPSRNMALLKIWGIEQHPPDQPDDYWRSRHAGGSRDVE